MNITVANRLYELRKKNGLSQEELAEKLGISRQSVSKWERAEASPDTDNLILLAELYGVTLDELLKGGAADAGGAQPKSDAAQADEAAEDAKKAETTVNIGPGGIHVEDGTDKVHISWKGIHIEDDEDNVNVGWTGVHSKSKAADDTAGAQKHARVVVNGKVVVDENKLKDDYKDFWHVLPVPLICLVAFLLLGIALNAWRWAWLLFLLVPIYYSLVDAIKQRNASHFAYPVLLAGLYLTAGIIFGRWHPEWVMFLTVPAYYAITNACHHARLRREGKDDVINIDFEAADDDCDGD